MYLNDDESDSDELFAALFLSGMAVEWMLASHQTSHNGR